MEFDGYWSLTASRDIPFDGASGIVTIMAIGELADYAAIGEGHALYFSNARVPEELWCHLCTFISSRGYARRLRRFWCTFWYAMRCIRVKGRSASTLDTLQSIAGGL